MFPFWLDLEISQLTEMLTSTIVAVASTIGWVFFSGRP